MYKCVEAFVIKHFVKFFAPCIHSCIDVVFAATICSLQYKWNEREVEDKEVKEGSK